MNVYQNNYTFIIFSKKTFPKNKYRLATVTVDQFNLYEVFSHMISTVNEWIMLTE